MVMMKLFSLALALAANLLFGVGIDTPHGKQFIALEPWPLASLAEAPSLILNSVAFVIAIVAGFVFVVIVDSLTTLGVACSLRLRFSAD